MPHVSWFWCGSLHVFACVAAWRMRGAPAPVRSSGMCSSQECAVVTTVVDEVLERGTTTRLEKCPACGETWQRHTGHSRHTGEKEPRPRATSNIQGHTVPHCPLCPTRRSQAVAPPDRDDLVEGGCRLAGVVESSTAVGPLRRVGQPSEHDDDVSSNTKPLLCADCLDIFHREHLGVDEHEGRLLEGGEGRLREQRRRAGEITTSTACRRWQRRRGMRQLMRK